MANTSDENFWITDQNPTTNVRDKLNDSSVYLNLTRANFQGTVRVSIYGIKGNERWNCTNRADFFDVEAGKKYMLYNRVHEDQYTGAQLVFSGINGRTIEGCWSPDSSPENGCEALKCAGPKGNISDTEFRFEGEGYHNTGPRCKTNKTSVYLDLRNSQFYGTVSVSIIGITNGKEENCTYKCDTFHLTSGQRYDLYNYVGERLHRHCYLRFNLQPGQVVVGKWSPDYATEAGVITINDQNSSQISGSAISHDLKSATKLIKVPYINQSNIPSGCEAVSATMLMQYYGVNITPDNFIHDCLEVRSWSSQNGRKYAADPNYAYVGNPYVRSGNNCGYGCYAPCLAKAMNKKLAPSYQAQVEIGRNLSDIIRCYTNDNIPVLIWATMNMTKMRITDSWTINYPDDKKGQTFQWKGGEHCLVLVGYDSNHYIFNDPYNNNGVCKFPKNLVEESYNSLGKQMLTIFKPNDVKITGPNSISDDQIQKIFLDKLNKIVQQIIPNAKVTYERPIEITLPGFAKITITLKKAAKSKISDGPNCIEISGGEATSKSGFKIDVDGTFLKWDFTEKKGNFNLQLGPKWFNLSIDTKLKNVQLKDLLNKITFNIGDGFLKVSYDFISNTYKITIEKKETFNKCEYTGTIEMEIQFLPQGLKINIPMPKLSREQGLMLCGIGVGVLCIVGTCVAAPAIGPIITSAFASGGGSVTVAAELIPAACTAAFALFHNVTGNLFSGKNPF
ncbi:C39 family peptidase [Histomonas meleagridis]|uniref:C39 family peptidase n=1 Tax=Histomonas meleagridis TaxID=135588 RepID=UPI00355AAF58|nr:C39 family peptidase [Histomonas meleagridis]KAH0805597.1 C39 family peptidase [Histomonas meleagridis]